MGRIGCGRGNSWRGWGGRVVGVKGRIRGRVKGSRLGGGDGGVGAGGVGVEVRLRTWH